MKINLNYFLYLKIYVKIFRTNVFTFSFSQIIFQKWFFRIVVNSAGRKDTCKLLLIFLIFYYGNKCNFPGIRRKKKSNSPLDVCVNIFIMQERCLVQGTRLLDSRNCACGYQHWLTGSLHQYSQVWFYSLIRNKQKSVINRIPTSLLYVKGICPDNVTFI